MSEPIFPSAPGAPAAPSVAEPQPEIRSNRKALFAVGGVVAAVAVGAGAFFMLNQAPADDGIALPAPRKPAASAPADASPTAKPTKQTPVKVVSVTAHDPFVALFAEETKPAGGSGSTDGSTGTDSGGSTTPGSGENGGAPTPAPTTPPDQSTSTAYKVGVTIIKPDTGAAQITVNGKPYAVSVGKSFAQFFTLYAIFNSDCVGVLFGDQNVPVCKSGDATVTA